jgi:hypothetical protein
MPTKVGTHDNDRMLLFRGLAWIPAYAGMTGGGDITGHTNKPPLASFCYWRLRCRFEGQPQAHYRSVSPFGVKPTMGAGVGAATAGTAEVRAAG